MRLILIIATCVWKACKKVGIIPSGGTSGYKSGITINLKEILVEILKRSDFIKV